MKTIQLLSGYRMMWILVMFDLPVGSKTERHDAATFRNNLLDIGFEMVQFSVYARYCAGRERMLAVKNTVGQCVPSGGKVDLLFFTDKQYEKIVHFHRGEKKCGTPIPQQFRLI